MTLLFKGILKKLDMIDKVDKNLTKSDTNFKIYCMISEVQCVYTLFSGHHSRFRSWCSISKGSIQRPIQI